MALNLRRRLTGFNHSRGGAMEKAITIPSLNGAAGSRFSEEFRLLALNVLSIMNEPSERALTVFSAFAGDGRSLIARNLGLALADHTNVLLIDANSHTSKVGGVLPSETSRNKRLQLLPPSKPALLPDGELSPDVTRAQDEGAFVLIDPPAAQASSDAYTLALRSGSALYVMRSQPGPAEIEVHQRAIAQLRRLNVNVLGIVVNER